MPAFDKNNIQSAYEKGGLSAKTTYTVLLLPTFSLAVLPVRDALVVKPSQWTESSNFTRRCGCFNQGNSGCCERSNSDCFAGRRSDQIYWQVCDCGNKLSRQANHNMGKRRVRLADTTVSEVSLTSDRLNSEEKTLLKEVVSKLRPALAPVIDSLGSVPLSLEQREELREALVEELINTGLHEDDEPNSRGLLLDRLIDRLGHF